MSHIRGVMVDRRIIVPWVPGKPAAGVRFQRLHALCERRNPKEYYQLYDSAL
jgi:hypothetical protein